MVAPALNFFGLLDQRRRSLGMTYATLAARSRVSQPTVHRILSGRHPTCSFANVAAIAQAMGMTADFRSELSAEQLRERQATKRARELVRLVQGTSGLEGQALDEQAIEQMVRQTVHELLAGSQRKLWADE